MGLQARLMSQALRKLTANIGKTMTVIFINQIRMKIGVMFGDPETTTGENALKFYASLRLDIRRTGAIKDGQDIVGNRTKVRVVKNKMAPPFKEAEFDIMYGEGISQTGDLIDIHGVDIGVIEKSGSGILSAASGSGGEKTPEALNREQGSFADAIRSRVRSGLGLPEINEETAADRP